MLSRLCACIVCVAFFITCPGISVAPTAVPPAVSPASGTEAYFRLESAALAEKKKEIRAAHAFRRVIEMHMLYHGVDYLTASKYARLIYDSSLANGLDPLWVTAVIQVETGRSFRPNLVSSHGAIGLMQVLTTNAQWLGTTPAALFEPHVNIQVGTAYLAYLQGRFGQRLGTIAYNQGEGNVERGTYLTWYYDLVLSAYYSIGGRR